MRSRRKYSYSKKSVIKQEDKALSYNIDSITLTVGGESHAKALSVILEGVKSGEEINLDELKKFMKRRAPGRDKFSTPRQEADEPIILSGLNNGFTTGSPICAMIENTNTKSADYGERLDVVRPGHADFPASVKFGNFFNFCGGGQFSGRLTAAMCFAGGIAKQILSKRGIEIHAHILSIHGVEDKSYKCEIIDVSKKDFPVISDTAAEKMMAEIDNARSNSDSVGGVVECAITGIDVGIGDALYGGLDGELAKAVFAIPAVKGIEFGAGFEAAEMFGSENNDEYFIKDGRVQTKTNNHGGILGGMTTGMPVIFDVAIKPTPSIAKSQNTVSVERMEDVQLEIKGRHDPCIVHRAVPVVEAVAALVVLGKLMK